MPFRILETEQDLPPPGPLSALAREKQDLDFKGFADRRHGLEHAKDIAAFANSLGGTLLIGAVDKTGSLVYDGVKGQTPLEVKEIYEAAGALCDPPVAVDVIPITLAAGPTVVAVNVSPLGTTVVAAPGVHTDTKTKQEVRAPNAWRYPIRRSSQTLWLKPGEVVMYMHPETRRAYVLLDSIPTSARNRVRFYYTGQMDLGNLDAELASVSLQLNAAVLELNDHHKAKTAACRVPLRDVEDVWEYSPGYWAVRVKGGLTQGGGGMSLSLLYQPRK